MGDKITARTQYDALGGVNVATSGAPITVPGRSVQPADLSGTLTNAVKAYIAAVNSRKTTAASQAASLMGGGRSAPARTSMYDRQMQDLSLRRARRADEMDALAADEAYKATLPIASQLRMTAGGRFGMYVPPETLSQNQQAKGFVGGMYGTEGTGDWAGRSTMYGGLNAPSYGGQAPNIGELSTVREAEAIRQREAEASARQRRG